jgi:hypothetical protein
MTHLQLNSKKRSSASLAATVCCLGLFLLGTGCHQATCFSPFSNRFFARFHQVETPPPAYSPPTYSLFVSPIFKSHPPRRVVMIESGPTSGNYEPTQKMILELSAQIRSTSAFEVIAPPNIRFKAQMDNILQGKFNEREVAQISRQYNADAVAFVRVNELNGHAPIRTSVTMAIVDSNETVVAFAIDGIWDTANPATGTEFRNYVSAQHHSVPVPNDIQLQSPKSLFSFAANQMANAVVASVY